MKQIKGRSLNSARIWSDKLRFKPNETVIHNGIIYQNVSGVNSEPGTDDNWILVANLDNAEIGLMDVLSLNQTVTSGVAGNFNRNEFSSVLSDQGFGAFDNFTGAGFYLKKDSIFAYNELGAETQLKSSEYNNSNIIIRLPSTSGEIALKNEILRIKTIL